jgi:hypothetical protein
MILENPSDILRGDIPKKLYPFFSGEPLRRLLNTLGNQNKFSGTDVNYFVFHEFYKQGKIKRRLKGFISLIKLVNFVLKNFQKEEFLIGCNEGGGLGLRLGFKSSPHFSYSGSFYYGWERSKRRLRNSSGDLMESIRRSDMILGSVLIFRVVDFLIRFLKIKPKIVVSENFFDNYHNAAIVAAFVNNGAKFYIREHTFPQYFTKNNYLELYTFVMDGFVGVLEDHTYPEEFFGSADVKTFDYEVGTKFNFGFSSSSKNIIVFLPPQRRLTWSSVESYELIDILELEERLQKSFPSMNILLRYHPIDKLTVQNYPMEASSVVLTYPTQAIRISLRNGFSTFYLPILKNDDYEKWAHDINGLQLIMV